MKRFFEVFERDVVVWPSSTYAAFRHARGSGRRSEVGADVRGHAADPSAHPGDARLSIRLAHRIDQDELEVLLHPLDQPFQIGITHVP